MTHSLMVRNTVIRSAIYICLAALKLYLVRGQSLMVHPAAMHDDGLFLSLAASIVAGEWLGDYSQFTLMKGPFYPLFIAVSYISHVPLLLAQQLLYLFACIVTVMALSPVVRSYSHQIVLFGLLLFNPASFTIHQVLREGIYPALTLLSVATALGVWLRLDGTPRKLLSWAIVLGLSLAAFWLTREEGIWILPALAPLYFGGILSFYLNQRRRGILILTLFLPPLIALTSVTAIALLNQYHYKIFTTVELKERDFVAAYSALSRVRHSNPIMTVPVPTEARLRIYSQSPVFSELQPFLEGDVGKAWGQIGPTRKFFVNSYNERLRSSLNDHFGVQFPLTGNEAFNFVLANYRTDPEFAKKFEALLGGKLAAKSLLEGKDDEEIRGGSFIWALRDATCLAGYCSDGAQASAFYRKLAEDVNTACATARLDCLPQRNTLTPPWSVLYLNHFLEAWVHSVRFLVTFDGMNPYASASLGSPEQLRFAKVLTRERLFPAQYNLRGWALSASGGTIDIKINDDRSRNSKIRVNLPSEDVYRYLLSQGVDSSQAKFSRFEVITDCIYDCSLILISDTEELDSIPISSVMQSVDRDRFKVVFETVSLHHVSPNATHFNSLKIKVLYYIKRGYQFSMPWLLLIALGCYTVFSFFLIKSGRFQREWWVPNVLLFLVIVRVSMLSYITVTSFPAINVQYMSPLYPLLIVFLLVSLTRVQNFFRHSA